MKKLRNSNRKNIKKSLLSKFGRKSGNQSTSVLLIAILLFALVGASFLVRSFAASATLYLTPATSTISLGSTFSVTIRENSNTEVINAVQANLTYNATMLQYLSTDTATSAFDLSGSSTGGNGSVSVARAKSGTSLTGDQIVAVVSFKVIGTGSVTVGFAPNSSLVRTSDTANVLSVTTPATYTLNDSTAPSVPTGLVAGTRTVNSIAFSWTASTDNKAVTGYKVYRNGTLVNGNVTPTSFTDSGLAPNTSYSYTVSAFDAAANTSAVSSAVAISTLPDTTAPSVPAGLTAGTKTVNSIAFSWTASTDNVSVTGYKIYRSGVQIGTTASTNYNQTGLTPNTSYSYTVAAYDGVGNTSAQTSPLVTSTLADTSAPSAPQGLSSPSQATTSIALAWNASTDNVGVAGYNILRNGTKVNTSTSTSFTDTSLAQGAQYTYTVTAYDLAGNTSAVSNSLTTTTKVKAGDVNSDGVVNIFDLSILANNFGQSGKTFAQGDLNNDGVVNIFDLSILAANWAT